MLQLFDAQDAIEPIDARLLEWGVLTVGRDPEADWPIRDPELGLSRRHCEFHVNGGGLFLRSLGRNGVCDDENGTLFPHEELSPVETPCALRLGRFRLVVTDRPDMPGADAAGTMVLGGAFGSSIDVPSQWEDEGRAPAQGQSSPAPAPAHDGALFEAFCEGAGLDSSMLSSEDPEEIMHRAGELYRQMVLGLGDLMSERTAARQRLDLDRTRIGGEANNPFKWAPSQRLAVDLLLAGKSSYLSGPEALQASFRDLKRHLVASFAGLRAGLRFVIDSFATDRIDEGIAGKGSPLKSRSAVRMEEVARRQQDLAEQVEDGRQGGSLDRAILAAYSDAETRLERGESV